MTKTTIYNILVRIFNLFKNMVLKKLLFEITFFEGIKMKNIKM